MASPTARCRCHSWPTIRTCSSTFIVVVWEPARWRCTEPSSAWFVFDKRTLDLPVSRRANEVTLFLGAVVVVALQGATAVGRKHDFFCAAFGEPVVVPAEDRLQIEFAKAIQQFIGVGGTIGHSGAQREMGQDHGWLLLVQPGQVIVEPLESGRLDFGFFVVLPFAGVQADELPAAMIEVVVEMRREALGISLAVGLRPIIVVADD